MNIGDILYGFKLLETTKIQEIDGEGFLFTHIKSGARLFFIKTDDDNKVFSIAFRTPPTDDTGVAHILEHSVLCGSRKYPLKEPFVELVKGSLNTFLNAMTYPDKTVYPVASRNDKDFQNLMDVYLDAVFYPGIYDEKEIFMQEGWHYEVENDALNVSGVVYNEMKGALSSPDSLLASKVMSTLYPDTAYGYESGGDPDAIPSLTREDFLNFHKKYYHPSNSYIYLYGDMDIAEKLKYIDEEYLSEFDKIEVNSNIERQQTFDGLKKAEYFYPISSEDNPAEKTFLSLNFITGDALDNETDLGLQILEHALIGSAMSPLKKAIIDAKLGKDVDSVTESEMLQPMFSVILSNSEKDRADKFLNIIEDTLKKLVKDGIDPLLLESAVNLFEFRFREADFGTAPKGLIYGLQALKNWLYDGKPYAPLMYEPLIARMRKGLKDGYFENLIEKYLLNNPHKTLVILSPSATVGKEKSDALKDKLAKIKANMTEGEISAVVSEVKKLRERQEREETEDALNSIPILKLSDIRKKSYEYPLKERKINGVKTLFSDVKTGGIAYLTMYFNADKVEQEDILTLYLIESLLQNVPTKNYSYEELGTRIDLATGGIDTDLTVIVKNEKADDYTPYFKVIGKSLINKLPDMLNLIEEIILRSEFTDKKRVKERLEEIVVGIELSFERSAHNIVAEEIASYSTAAHYYSALGDLPFYRYLKAFLANFDKEFEKLSKNAKRIIERVFTKENLIVSATLPESDYGKFKDEFAKFTDKLSNKTFEKAKYNFEIARKNEGLMSPSLVQYVGKGGNFIKLGEKYTGVLHILETILRYDYFWNNIRVKGGAYGAFSKFNRDGSLFFGSYRDPNLKETLEVFDKTADYIENFNVNDREMDKFIIGTIGNIDMPLTPKMKGDVASSTYLREISYEDRQKSRNEILSARQKDVRDLSKLIRRVMEENNVCVFGNEENLKANADVFKNLVKVSED
ncbi:MAG: insulinase family protein [Selenomonadaceae bacterium]|nr:insulinase family protein [Selenomonadaceae bacterium]